MDGRSTDPFPLPGQPSGMTHFPPPSAFDDRFSYQEQWDAYKDAQPNHIVLFDAVFYNPSESDTGRQLLAACGSNGVLYVWEVPSPRVLDDCDSRMVDSYVSHYRAGPPNTDREEDDENFFPIHSIPISKSVLYRLRFHRKQKRTLLFVSGDEGVLVFHWDDLLSQGVSGKTTVPPISKFQPYPSPYSSYVEVNDMCVHGEYLYAAPGDSFGCYKWNLETEQLVTIYKTSLANNNNGIGYLHTVSSAATKTNSSNLILTGGEDGILSIWDAQQDRLVESIDMSSHTSKDDHHQSSKGLSPSGIGKMRSTSASGAKRLISTSAVVDENWWVVAGGSGSSISSFPSRQWQRQQKRTSENGYIATLYAPTRQVIKTVDTRESIKQIDLLCEDHSDPTTTTLLSVGNESVVSQWHPVSLERTKRVPTSLACSYGIAVSNTSDYVAIAGVGDYVDLYTQNGTEQLVRLQCGPRKK